MIGCMSIFMRDSTFIDSLEYFHKCMKKEKNGNNSLFFYKGGRAQLDKEIHCKKERDNKN
jgi:hypothetical protein